jgi:hypothetical protein
MRFRNQTPGRWAPAKPASATASEKRLNPLT